MLAFIERAFPTCHIQALLDNLDTALNAYGLAVDGVTRYEILLHLAIQVSRVSRDNILECDFVTIPGPRSSAWEAASVLAAGIELSEHLSYSNNERGYLALLIYALSTPQTPEARNRDRPSQSICERVRRSLAFLYSQLPLTVSNKEFIEVTSDWFSRMLARQHAGFTITNPVYSLLRNSHPKIYDMATWALSDLQDDWGTLHRPREEASWLTAVILTLTEEHPLLETRLKTRLICPTSPAHAERIASQLVSRAGNRLEIIDITTTTDINDDPANLSLTISVVPTKRSTHTLVISPFPTERDYQAVAEKCTTIQYQRNLCMLALYFRYYLRETTFVRSRGSHTRTDVLDELCGLLTAEGLVKQDFREQIERRELIDTTSFANVVALPHICTSNVQRNSIAVFLSDEPISWGAGAVNLVIVTAIERNLLQDFYAIYEMCIETFSKPTNIAAMLTATCSQDFIERIESLS